jgi:beta-glucosidase
LGVDAYRFSVSWPRVLPEGDGEVNRQGLDFYRRLAQGMRERDIEPWLTLYHWDLPQALQDRGGWANRDTCSAFARYAAVMADGLGDLVGHWITHNEPWVAAYLGHLYGIHAPGHQDWSEALAAGHHILLSHGMAATELRRRLGQARIGIALDCRPARPRTDSPADIEATRHFDGFRNRWFFDPVLGHGYPDDMVAAFTESARLDKDLVRPGDTETIAADLDFLGLNYYTTLSVTAGEEEVDEPEHPPGPNPDEGHTEMGWAIDPSGLEGYLHHLHDRYRPPSLVVTENGASFSTGPDRTGAIDDARRIRYLSDHIAAVLQARADGVPVDGYFVWSLLDNLEWTLGFDQRFGLVWVDHRSQQRIPKNSYRWYRDTIQDLR